MGSGLSPQKYDHIEDKIGDADMLSLNDCDLNNFHMVPVLMLLLLPLADGVMNAKGNC